MSFNIAKQAKRLLTAVAGATIFLCCAAGNNPVEQYTAALQKLAANCSMDYSSTITYPGGRSYVITGHMAMTNSNYYDSSNIRFVLRNDNWIVQATHQDKHFSYLYLPGWKAAFGNHLEPETSGYLLSKEQFLHFQDYKISTQSATGYSIQLKYEDEKIPFKELTIHFEKGNLVPLDYTGKLSYPTWEAYDDDGQASQRDTGRINISFSCYHIQPAADPGIFDDSRLIAIHNGKATLKRFTDYTTTRIK